MKKLNNENIFRNRKLLYVFMKKEMCCQKLVKDNLIKLEF